MRTKRRLALTVLIGAAALAVAAFPFRATWWGGWILAVAEAGVVGGLADWFAVTAIFRRPLGLPIPHTALIPANWELLATRVGTMVGDRVLTHEYLAHELARVDLAELLVRAAERLHRRDLEAVTRVLLSWAAREVRIPRGGEPFARLGRLLAAQPMAPLLASALEAAGQQGWDRRVLGTMASTLADALERGELRRAVSELIDDLLDRYRERTGLYPRLALGLADLFGLIDRDRIVAALHAFLGEVGQDPGHPLRGRFAEAVADFAARLRTDAALIARVEDLKGELLVSPVLARLAADALAALHRALLGDLEKPASETVAWVADRLERGRQALLTDPELRREVERWTKDRAVELLERYHGRIAGFIEKGVRALGPEGAVRLIEEHAGDDLQYIRVNGTVVGGLAGGALYAIHLLLRLL